MFKKPIYITFIISLVGALLTFLSLIFAEVDDAFLLSFGPLASGGLLFFAAQWVLEKFIYARVKLLFNKILNITYERKVLKLLEDPFESIDARVDSYLKEQQKEELLLQKQQSFRREYVGNISHELKTPIFTIQGYVNTLLDGGLEDETINRDYLLRADRSIERIIDLLDDLDLITRLDSGEFPLQIETFDVLQICKEVFDSLELKANERGTKLQFSARSKGQIFVDADRTRIYQVISNLVVNAIKYGKDEGTVTIDLNKISEDHILIEVIDDGLGISEENLLRIFERFYRVDKSGGRKLGGSGLGLSIVKHIVEAHGQTLNVKSKVGEGSNFSFTLKLS